MKKFKNVLGVKGVLDTQFVLGADIKPTKVSIDKVKIDKKFFSTFMTSVAIKVAKKRGWVCSDDLRFIAEKYNIPAPASGSWGKVFLHKRWESIGFMKSTRKEANGRQIQKWAWVREAT